MPFVTRAALAALLAINLANCGAAVWTETPKGPPHQEVDGAVMTYALAQGTLNIQAELKKNDLTGALGQTIGNVLDGKKTAIGIFGSLLTAVLQVAGPSFPLSNILPVLGAAAPGLGSVALPIFLAMGAWGVLGKMEKWAGASPQPPPK